MHRGFEKLDPKWQEFAASLRKGDVYVKMPISKARALGMIWNILSQKIMMTAQVMDAMTDLIRIITQEAVGSRTYGIASVFYMVSVDQCKKDIELVSQLVEGDETGVFQLFKETLEKGLQSDPAVDWISRVGGPKPHRFEALQPESNTVNVSFEDLFDFPDESNV